MSQSSKTKARLRANVSILPIIVQFDLQITDTLFRKAITEIKTFQYLAYPVGPSLQLSLLVLLLLFQLAIFHSSNESNDRTL